MKFYLKRFLSLSLVFSCFCNFQVLAVHKMPTSQEYIDSYKATNYIDISNENMIEDFEYLWKTLQENYPYFGVIERMGIDPEKIYKSYKSKIEACNNDFDFYNYIIKFLAEFKGTGHLYTIRANEINSFTNVYYPILYSSDEMYTHFKPWVDTLLNEETLKNYALFNLMCNPPELWAIKLTEENKNNTNNQVESQNDVWWIDTKILEENKTAYMKIDSFGSDLINKSKDTIMNFYEEAKDCQNLIIDITENGGGDYNFWRNLLAEPNIDKKIEYNTYTLFKLGENNKKYIDFEFQPINELPDFERINKDDLKSFDGFAKTEDVIVPSSDEKAFKGKIWLLVSPNVYSASENFAIFCKTTGFATIVGTPTGGDGIGSDPALITLPNSRIIVRYSYDYGINADGSGNEEFGTTPDILVKEGESPLDACLKAIDNQ